MFKYKGCGLKNIYLSNGYIEKKTHYGKVVSIEDVEGLHRAIGSFLIKNKEKLSGAEFRFLRKEMNMSQKTFGELIGVEGQSVAIWEKLGKIPKYADLFIRLFYMGRVIHENTVICELVDRLNEMDQQENQKFIFKETDSGWIESEAA